MPQIRLLVSVAGERGQVSGGIGEVLTVDPETARKWCDGERAERVITREAVVEKTVAVTGAHAVFTASSVRRGRPPKVTGA